MKSARAAVAQFESVGTTTTSTHFKFFHIFLEMQQTMFAVWACDSSKLTRGDDAQRRFFLFFFHVERCIKIE